MRSKLLTKLFFVFCAILIGSTVLDVQTSSLHAQSISTFPGDGGIKGSSADIWREIKQGKLGKTTSPDKARGMLIQNQGEQWRNTRNDMVFTYGAIGIFGMIAVLILFFLVRGQIKLDGELSGRKVLRFETIERFNHWAMAGSFILLGLSGLNMLYGRAVLVPILGHETFSLLAGGAKFIHNNLSWVFMLSLIGTIIFWTKDNVWDRFDLNWILKGGGLFSKGVHPPSAKFNFGEKTMFWLVVTGGIAMSYTGLTLLFPYLFGTLETMQLMQIIHAIVALIMCSAILGHIYIGTIGMQGAIDGMKTGYVDETWAKEHHSAWAETHGIKVDHNPKDEEHITKEALQNETL